ncbi:hypothetical protein GPJ56_010285 [Histomonas meleagridis]|nr:hypothetical protein GPJ56_010285 [Histomonas meleagridis]
MDPYYLLQKEVITGIDNLQEMLNNREDMLNDSRGVNVEIFKTLGVKMMNDINTIRGFLKDIEESIQQVRQNPEIFQLSENELSLRDSFVQQSTINLNDIEQNMKAQSSNQRIQFHRPSFHEDPLFPQETNDPQTQLQLHQEERIEAIGHSVGLQMQIGKEIIQEIDDQRQLILDLEDGVDNAQTAMRKVTRQITEIIDNEGRGPTFCSLWTFRCTYFNFIFCYMKIKIF